MNAELQPYGSFTSQMCFVIMRSFCADVAAIYFDTIDSISIRIRLVNSPQSENVDDDVVIHLSESGDAMTAANSKNLNVFVSQRWPPNCSRNATNNNKNEFICKSLVVSFLPIISFYSHNSVGNCWISVHTGFQSSFRKRLHRFESTARLKETTW